MAEPELCGSSLLNRDFPFPNLVFPSRNSREIVPISGKGKLKFGQVGLQITSAFPT